MARLGKFLLTFLLLVCVLSLSVEAKKKKKAQRLVKDYQLKIRPEPFANRKEGVEWIEGALKKVAKRTKDIDFEIKFGKGVETIFHEQRMDTEGNAFVANYITLRIRHFDTGDSAGKAEMSFKFNSLDNEYARNAPCGCAKKWLHEEQCKQKLEQDVHQNFVKSACTSKIVGLDSSFNVSSVAELEGYFDQVTKFVGVQHEHKLKLWEKEKSNNYFWRLEDIPVRISGKKGHATLKLRYESKRACDEGTTAPLDGEFKFKVKGPELDGGPFPAKALADSTTYYRELLSEEKLNVEFGDQPCRFGWGPGYVVDDSYEAIAWDDEEYDDSDDGLGFDVPII